MMAAETYSQDRLVRLLRLLQPAPRDWITKVERTISDLGSGARASAGERVTGAVISAGALYTVGRVELRGYLRGWGDAKEIGAAAQLRF